MENPTAGTEAFRKESLVGPDAAHGRVLAECIEESLDATPLDVASP
jgi:hypothetical protein